MLLTEVKKHKKPHNVDVTSFTVKSKTHKSRTFFGGLWGGWGSNYSDNDADDSSGVGDSGGDSGGGV